MEVEIERLNEAGEVVETATGTVREIRHGFCFLEGEAEGPYCLADDAHAGYWQCYPESQERLSAKSVAACRDKMPTLVPT
jgi:hypothetical protein